MGSGCAPTCQEVPPCHNETANAATVAVMGSRTQNDSANSSPASMLTSIFHQVPDGR